MSERIAIISTSYPRQPGDASGHFVAAEVKQLVRAGHDVSVFVPGSGPREQDGARLHWIADGGAFGWPGALARLKEHPTRVAGAAAFATRAVRAVHAAGPYVRVQAHFLLPSAWPIATLAFSKASPTELELVGHGSDVRLFCRLPPSLRRHIARAWLLRSARLRVTSSELASLLSAANPELYESVRVEPSPIDVEGVPERATARRSLGLHATKPLALIVSRLIPGKRVAIALRALAPFNEWSVVVVGDGPELASLRRDFPSAHFTGRLARPDALAYIAAADVLVSASAEEGAPSVVREARALGVRVVAVAAGDLTEWAKTDPGLSVVRP
ncbi:MAG TPA: glycosyltransferase family 4 protein [Polyangiaceae bacterium]